MNKKVININIRAIKILIISIVFIALIVAISLKKLIKPKNNIMYTKIDTIDYSKEFQIKNNEIEQEELKDIELTYLGLKEYQNMPERIGKYKIIGKVSCEKTNLEQYILNETTEESLNLSVTKLCGPKANNIGNLCIIGHNYINSKMFGSLNKIEVGDIIKITDTYDRTIEYMVYNIFTSSPKDTSCLSQNTEGEREITLITCTFTGVNRLIVKAVENYD